MRWPGVLPIVFASLVTIVLAGEASATTPPPGYVFQETITLTTALTTQGAT
jgi:hypothetical protein